MSVFRFDPLSEAESRWINKQEQSLLKAHYKLKQLNVVMCAYCRTIIHQSTTKAHPDFSSRIADFKNVRTTLEEDRVLFYCNTCGKEMA
jgi:hypothetical protein